MAIDWSSDLPNRLLNRPTYRSPNQEELRRYKEAINSAKGALWNAASTATPIGEEVGRMIGGEVDVSGLMTSPEPPVDLRSSRAEVSRPPQSGWTPEERAQLLAEELSGEADNPQMALDRAQEYDTDRELRTLRRLAYGVREVTPSGGTLSQTGMAKTGWVPESVDEDLRRQYTRAKRLSEMYAGEVPEGGGGLTREQIAERDINLELMKARYAPENRGRTVAEGRIGAARMVIDQLNETLGMKYPQAIVVDPETGEAVGIDYSLLSQEGREEYDLAMKRASELMAGVYRQNPMDVFPQNLGTTNPVTPTK